MMPSRGLQAIRGSAPRLYQQQCRNVIFFSPSRSLPSPLTTPQLSSRTLPRASTLASPRSTIASSQWGIRSAGAAFSLSAIRHASTVPTTPTPGPASAPQAPLTEPAAAATAAPTPTPYNLDTITLDDVEVAAANDLVSSIPERLGFLKEIGLDYGWGPTSVIQWTLEHIHITGGLPWWGAIAATAILVRVATFPLYLKSADQAARQSALMTITAPISARMTAAQKANDQTGVMRAWSELNAVRKRAGMSYTKQFAPMLVQSVIGYCSFKLMRGMANLPVPGLKDGGFGWVTDLTITDGYLLLPAIMAGAMHVMFRYGGESGQNNELMNPGMKSFMLWGMPGVIFLITGWQPAALCIWFAASGAWAMGQAMLMQKPAVRKFFGITPMYRAKANDSENSSKNLMAIARAATQKPGAVVDTTATSKSAPKTGSSAMSYQAPNVRTTSARGSASASISASKPAAPAPAKPNVIEAMKGKWSDVQAMAKNHLAERREQKDKETLAQQAQSYEKRAKLKRDMAKRASR
ncbi:hypothetical protein MBLNU13_g00832t1 [Cladosporium sp. NU13]